MQHQWQAGELAEGLPGSLLISGQRVPLQHDTILLRLQH